LVTRHKEKLVTGMTRRGYAQDLAERVFAQIEGFGSYGFPESHAASFAHLVYASAWLKRHHPAAFACALLNSQPMGFYAPAQIMRDAREHGVVVRAVDVNASNWDSSLEEAPESTGRLALRLGLRLVAGLAARDGDALLAARAARNGAPFVSVEDLAWRAGLSQGALSALAAANAFPGLLRRDAAWAARGARGTPRDLPLFAVRDGVGAALADEAPILPEAKPLLPVEHEGESIVNDYARLGLTLGRHPLALLRAQLRAEGLRDTRDLQAWKSSRLLRLAGLVLMRQRPGSAKGVIFITIEDEHGTANLVVYTDVAARDRRALRGARLLEVEGRVEREDRHAEVPIIHLIARRLVDRSDLLEGLLREAGSDWAAAALGRADEVVRPQDDRRPPRAKLPASRDFR
jgi:error-prone DNA polymerase